MIITSEETTIQTTKRVYTAPAPDTSNIVATLDGSVVSIVYGGSALAITVDALPALTALVATIGAAIDPIIPDPAPAPTPPADPATDPAVDPAVDPTTAPTV